nr:S-layer homology domain-containing protein [uncultured Dysosmobacter sp.]
MKKFLSLVLALVMTMSLVTVSAGAKDFTDNSKINYKEAVDVMSAVKVIDGYAEGDFRPANTLTRGAAAKIICNLILGPTTAEALVADAAPYSDVPTTNTFAGYIAYCAKEGIISGYADGTFRPAASLSGYAFMKMLLGALGYDAETEGYTGNNWSINVAKRALNIGLDDDLNGSFNGTKAVTREEACLYAFNTLKATMVEYENNNSVTVNGITFTNKSTAKEVTTGNVRGLAIGDNETLQFAEKYFPDLKGTNEEDGDDFGRPAITWKVKSKEVGTYAKTPDLTYTDEVKGKTIYADLGKGKVTEANDDIVIYKNGTKDRVAGFELTKDCSEKVGGKGTLTEVYFEENGNDKTVTIVEIETYLAQVTGDYDKDDEELDIEFVGNNAPSVDSTTLSLDDLSNLADFEDEDYVLVTIATNDDDDYYVASIVKAEKVTATVTSYTKDDSVTAGGTKYSYNATFESDNNYVIKDEYDLYLDTYGNVIYTDGVSADDDVIYISQIAKDGKLTSSKVIGAALFLDGSYKEITLNKDVAGDKFKDYTDEEIAKFADGWYSFKEKSDGSYDLKKSLDSDEPTTEASDKITAKDSIKVAGVRATSKTQFIVTGALDESGKAYTGIKNVPAITNSSNDKDDMAFVSIVMDGNYAKYVLISKGDAKDKSTAKSGDLVYILESAPTDETVNEAEDTIYTYDAIVNGKVTSVDINSDADVVGANGEVKIGLYEDVVYTDKVITDMTKAEADNDDFNKCEDYTIQPYAANSKITQKGSVVTFVDADASSDAYYLADSAKIMVVTVKTSGKDAGKYDEVKTVTAKKLVSDYSEQIATDFGTAKFSVTGVLDSDGNFTYLFVDLH